MEKINQIYNLKNIKRAVTFGKFDGVHLGHRKLMEKIMKKKQYGLAPTVFTFDKSPASLFLNDNNDRKFKTILTKEERETIFAHIGIETLFEYEVTLRNLSIPAEKFVTDIIRDRLNAKYIAVGEDFCFGAKRKGNVKLLAQMADFCGYELEIVKKKELDGSIISSSRIKECLINGKIGEANRLLGYNYSTTGEIVTGNRLGRTWNIPTINVPWSEEKLAPEFGVYFSRVEIENKEYFGMTNLGIKPTIEGEYKPGTETYLYNCNEDLYGKIARISFIHFRRKEQKFASIDELKTALYKDIEAGKGFFGL